MLAIPRPGSRVDSRARIVSIAVALGIALGTSVAVFPPQFAALVIAFVATAIIGLPALLLAVAVPFRFDFGIGVSVGISDVAIFGLAVHAIVTNRNARPLPLSAWAFVLIACGSILWSVDRTKSADAIVLLAESAVAAIAVRATLSTEEDIRHFLKAWMLLGLFAATASLVLYLGGNPQVAWNLQGPTSADQLLSQTLRLGSPFWGPSNYYASITLLFIPVALLSFIRGQHSILALLTLATLAVSLFLTTSRGALLSAILVLTVAVIFVLYRVSIGKGGKLTARTVILFLACSVALAIFGKELIEYFFTSRQQSVGNLGSNDRESYLQLGLGLLPRYGLLGAGYGASGALAPTLKSGLHNYPLQLWLELGIAGIVAAAMVALRVVRKLRTALKGQPSVGAAVSLLLTAGLVAIPLVILNALVEASFEGVVFSQLFGIFIGAALAASDLSSRRTASE